ncbi:MAG: DNA translocase FtsK, partial [Bacteroidales bacterium]|nr:DNA translocase FtsK [Bacteroidales bacterium]
EEEEDDDDYLVIDRTDKTTGKARRPEVADDEITIRVEPMETEPQEEKEPENNQPEEPEEDEIKVHIEEPEPETEPLSESNANTNEEVGAVVYTTAKNTAEAGGFAAANAPQNETATVATPVKTEPKEEQSQVNEKIKDDKEFQDILYISKKRSAEEVITGPTKIGDMVVSVAAEEAQATNLGEMQLKEYGLDTKYDPRADLSSYRFPTLDLLKDYAPSTEKPTIDELENKQAAIRTTLKNFGIEIDSIKASIGPTVTLYEIIPAPGVRISKIKNLEDDIALSLAALGIRIIAPMPGKGTIGIEAPNSNPETVPMKAVLSSEKFVSSRMELPIALGKTISNETYVADLTKMPHLLVAGATGQGKSVGINAIITSLLYKKHPAELKFVLVDPKKVELSIYSKIERHYLAKLPDSEDAVITDVKKVVRTLNSLCVEMDQRYDLLKDADCRNIKEYNAKFINRKLNPKEGHRFLPYIVLVVDEFADLIMTAGREVETPIARLAQLARAIGIHLIIATQRPSVNIITGPIKANFPARVAFKVFSKVDSRTILDTGGADQLIGRGDMLLSIGNDLIRIQCAFIDTPEVAALCDMIGEQRGYPDAMYLPDVPDENESESGRRDLDPNERDEYFVEAARLLVATQQGSTSMLQRKMKLGYNRAGRLMDQLEDAGIVGPSVGSKAREVLIKDENTLNIYLQENGLL